MGIGADSRRTADQDTSGVGRRHCGADRAGRGDESALTRPHGRTAALILLAYAVVIALRMPQIVLEGRFWGEEGAIFFVNAWTLDPIRALLTPVGGYLNVVATAATLAARWGPRLELAPYVTITVAWLFQLCPPALLLCARDGWLGDRRVRFAGVLLLLFVPAAEEIWLQTLHCQFELMLSCGILLALAVPTGRLAAFSLFLLLLAPLCGPGAIALLPLFLLRACMERSRGRVLQAVALGLGSAIQLSLFFSVGTERAYGTDPAVLLSLVTVKHLAIPFLGIGEARAIGERVRDVLAAGRVPWLAVVAPLVAVAALFGAIVRSRAWTSLWLLLGAAMVAGSGYVGALDGAMALLNEFAGERYAFVPQSLLALSLLALAASGRGVIRLLAAGLCFWLLVAGVEQFRHPWRAARDGPDWREQVALWRANPGHELAVWPTGWVMRLDVTSMHAGANTNPD